jgi:outer membrane protein assembly factor BamB
VLRGAEILIAQAGPAAAYVAHHGQVERFPARDVVVPAMGASRGVEVRFSHAALSPGDTLLLFDSVTAEHTPEEAIASAIVYTGIEAALQNLEKLADSGNLTALVVEGAAEGRTKAPVAAITEEPAPMEAARPAIRLPALPILQRREAQPEAPEKAPVEPVVSEEAVEPAPTPEPEGEAVEGTPRVAWTQRVGESIAHLNLSARARTIGGSLAAGLTVAAQGVATILQRTLPEGALTPRPRGKGANTALMGVALVIPIVVLGLVATTYTEYSTLAQFQALLSGARNAADQAATLKEPVAQREQWTSALSQATSAVAMRPADLEARQVRDRAQRELDKLDNVLRLTMSLLWDFKTPGSRRLATQGLSLYVLDRTAASVVQLTLNESGNGVTDRGELPTRAARGLTVNDRQVGDLIDLVWMPTGGTRTRSSLLILDSNGLLDYDQGWGLRSVSFGQGTVPAGARTLAAFGGNLYLLDVSANQIWRYRPQGDGYGGTPEAYFEKSPGDLSTAIDMAIDGNVYALLSDGTMRKFFGGQEKTFAVSGISEKIKRPVALAVDAEARRGAVYVADADGARIVQLNTDGALVRQIRATDEAFNALEDILVDERKGQLFAISSGKLYTARLPVTP